MEYLSEVSGGLDVWLLSLRSAVETALFTRVDREKEGDWLLKYFPFRLNSV